MQINDKSFPISKYFNLEQITPGVFIAFPIQRVGGLGNAGIIDLGDQTLIYDTFESPIIAKDLRVASEYLTNRPPYLVLNSHSHADHWFGNQVFPPESIVMATKESAALMKDYLAEVDEDKSDPSEYKAYLQDQAKQLEIEPDPIKRRMLKSTIARWNFYLESLPNLNLRLPDQTFF